MNIRLRQVKWYGGRKYVVVQKCNETDYEKQDLCFSGMGSYNINFVIIFLCKILDCKVEDVLTYHKEQ